jgi:hypothetical protein
MLVARHSKEQASRKIKEGKEKSRLRPIYSQKPARKRFSYPPLDSA